MDRDPENEKEFYIVEITPICKNMWWLKQSLVGLTCDQTWEVTNNLEENEFPLPVT